MPASSPSVRAALCLLLLLSPVGAPLMGALISHCPADPSMAPGGPFEMGMSYCGISRPMEHFYQRAMMLSFMPMVLVGPILGMVVSVGWWSAALGSAAVFLGQLWRAAASATIERL